MTASASVTPQTSMETGRLLDPRERLIEAPRDAEACQQPADDQEPKEAKCATLNAAVGDPAVFQRDSAGAVGTIGVLLPSGFMPVQWGAITYLASGLSTREVAKRCVVSPNTVAKWLQMPRFVRAVEEATQRHVGRVHDLLLEGEVRASQTLLAALDAMAPVKSGSKVTMAPDWPSRIKAADSLLDRRSERGKPVERVQAQNFNFTAEARSELASALHDPAVQKMLSEDPDLKSRLVLELARMQPAAGTDSLPALPPSVPDDEPSGSAGDREPTTLEAR